MKRQSKTVDYIKTALIALLFISILIMVFMHFEILRQKNAEAPGLSDSVRLNADIEGDYDELYEKALIPSSVAVKAKGAKLFSITSGSDFMHEVYSLLERNIVYMLSGSCSGAYEEDSEAFDRALSSDDFIYLNYHKELPAVLIYMHALGDNFDLDVSSSPCGNKTSSVTVKELLIFPEVTEKDKVFAMSRSISGEVTTFKIEKVSNEALVYTSDFDIYQRATAFALSNFYGTEDNSHFLPSTLIYTAPQNANKIKVMDGAKGLSTDKAAQAEIANLLNINPDKTGSYFDQAIGGTVYMATHGVLSVCDNKITYSTNQSAGGGIELSEYSDKDAGNEHTLYECLSIAESLVSKISSVNYDYSLPGGEADTIITGLYRKGDKLVLEYGYFYDNIPISSDSPALRIEMTSLKITSVEIFPVSVTTIRGDIQRSIAPEWTISIMKDKISDDSLYSITYKYFHTGGNVYEAEWIPTKIRSK